MTSRTSTAATPVSAYLCGREGVAGDGKALFLSLLSSNYKKQKKITLSISSQMVHSFPSLPLLNQCSHLPYCPSQDHKQEATPPHFRKASLSPLQQQPTAPFPDSFTALQPLSSHKPRTHNTHHPDARLSSCKKQWWEGGKGR